MQISKSTINLLVLTVFIIVVWIATELYFLSKKDLSLELDKKLTPDKLATFDPTLDTKTIDILKKNQAESQQAVDLPSPTPSPTPRFRSTRTVTPTP